MLYFVPGTMQALFCEQKVWPASVSLHKKPDSRHFLHYQDHIAGGKEEWC